MPPQQRNTIFEDETAERCDKPTRTPCRSKEQFEDEAAVVVSKRFRFALSNNEMYPIPHIDDLSDEEVKATWYEHEDYEAIKKSIIPLIRKMMKNEEVAETNRQTTRGLEYRTRDGAIRRQTNKSRAMTVVLDEIDRQLEFAGYVNEEILRKVYQSVSKQCQDEAHDLALGDVEAAREGCEDITMQVILQHEQEACRALPGRNKSFSKMFKQMRIGRRSPVDEQRRTVGLAA
jgi:hypothetical protein